MPQKVRAVQPPSSSFMHKPYKTTPRLSTNLVRVVAEADLDVPRGARRTATTIGEAVQTVDEHRAVEGVCVDAIGQSAAQCVRKQLG